MPAAPQPQPAWRTILPVAAAGLLVAVAVLGLQLLRLDGDPTAPFFVGTSWRLDEELAERGVRVRVEPGNGYDGQWFLGQAHDPLLGDRLAAGFDMPRYRALRPLQPLVGWLLAGGRAAALPVALLAVGPLAVALGCGACARLVAAFGRSPWWGLGFALVPGVVVGVAFATAEPLGLALAALGLSLAADRRHLAAGLALAGAALTKETYLAFAGATALWLLFRPGPARLPRAERLGPALAVAVPGVVGLGLWWLYVLARLPASVSDAAGTELFTVPLAGWAHTLARVAGGDYLADAPVGPLGPALVVATLGLLLAAVLVAPRRLAVLPGWVGLLVPLLGLALTGWLLDRWLSSMRALAPSVLAAGLLLVTAGRSALQLRRDRPQGALGPAGPSRGA
jgi:hypothetical protein